MTTPLLSDQPVLEIQSLNIAFPNGSGGARTVVQDFSLSLRSGERYALVGESGSGKTVTALSVLRLVDQAQVQGRVVWKGEDLLTVSEDRIRSVRGREVAVVFQEPMTALNPLLTIGVQIAEVIEQHESLSPSAVRERVEALLEQVGMDEPRRRAAAYPHQLSGGQRQRALIAMALACRPSLLIADEPTTALDVTLRQQVLELLAKIQEETGLSVLLITHDLPMVRSFAHRVGVMQNGRLVEEGPVETVFQSPKEPYTRKLLAAQPHRMVEGVVARTQPRLDVRRLSARYPAGRSLWQSSWNTVVSEVSFLLGSGETLGIVGESGSGKTTLGMAILRLTDAQVSGQVRLQDIDLYGLSSEAMRKTRRRVQVVFQDPYSALSPRLTIQETLEEGLALHLPKLTAAERLARCEQVLDEVGLPRESLGRYPHEFSGGQRQRIAIARAVLLEPDLILLDEPTSALDLTIQMQILELLVKLQQRRGLSYLFISHDLAVIRAVAHRTIVMRHGQVVDSGPTDELMRRPRHLYTCELLDAAFPHERLVQADQ